MPAAVPPAENGAPRSELEQLQLRAGQVTDDVSTFLICFLNNLDILPTIVWEAVIQHDYLTMR